MTLTKCEHPNFRADVEVNRLTDNEGGRVTGYVADVKVKCSECDMPFQFMGIKGGLHPNEPRVSFDKSELRAPIIPMEED